jgi:branched-chain amino acid transport system substrate-binding protein
VRARLAVLAVVLALVAASCSPGGGSGGSGSSGTVTIGGIYPTTGKQGPGGVDEERGAALAVQLANDQGGIHGKQIKMKLLDVEAGTAAPQAMDKLHAQGIQIVLGTYGSTISGPASVAAHRNGMLLWETGAVGETADGAGAGDSFFRIAPSGSNLGRAGVAFIRDQLAPLLPAQPRRYAVAYVDDAYGRAVGLGAVDEVDGSPGSELAGAFPYDVNAFDPKELVARIAATQPDVLFVSAYLHDGIAIRKATIDAQLPLLASVGTSSSYCMPAFAAALGPGAVGLFASDKPDAADVRLDALTAEGRRNLAWARDRYKQLYNQAMSTAALAGFANAWALVGHVLPAAPGLSAPEVAATALATKLPAGTLANGAGLDLAPPGARDAGENRAAVSVIWQWLDPETQVVVYPPAFATSRLTPLAIQTR